MSEEVGLESGRRCPVCGRTLVDKKKKALTMLGLAGWDEKDVTPEVIKKAYKTLARVGHPDVGGSVDLFTEIKDAKETLLKNVDVEKEVDKIGRDTIVKHVKECKNTWRPGMQCPVCRRL